MDRLRQFDATELAAKVGAIQLLPENADRFVSIIRATAAIACLQLERRSGRTISDVEWRSCLKAAPFDDEAVRFFDDPYEGAFTEALSFFQGVYTVFPGIIPDGPFIVRALLEAVFLGADRLGPREVRRAIRETALAALAVGHAVATRAGLSRATRPEPAPSGEITWPEAKRARVLEAAVQFTDEQLGHLFAPYDLSLSALDPFCYRAGDYTPGASELLLNATQRTPILRSEGKFIVVAPWGLLTAIRTAILGIAKQCGILNELLRAFRATVLWHCEKYLHIAGYTVIASRQIQLAGHSVDEKLYRFDLDKVLVLTVVCDELKQDQPGETNWDTKGWSSALAKHIPAVNRELLRMYSHIVGVLHLTIAQGIGRPFHLAVNREEPGALQSLRVVMQVQDLETFSLLEGGNPLALWQFAAAKDRTQQITRFFSGGFLDNYAVYKSHDQSFYFGDSGRPDLVLALSAGSQIRIKALEEFDPHGAVIPGSNGVGEVIRFVSDKAVPIYAPLPDPDSPILFLIEGAPIPIWIVTPDPSQYPHSKYRTLYLQIADCVAYWTWQSIEFLTTLLGRGSGGITRLEIHLELEDSPEWFDPSPIGAKSGETLSVEWISQDKLRINVAAAFIAECNSATNDAERRLLSRLLGALAGRFSSDIPAGAPQAVRNAVEQIAPRGIKKKIVVFSGIVGEEASDVGVPRFREVQPSEEQLVLDQIGQYVTSDLGLPIGDVERERRVDVLHRVVAFVFQELSRGIAELSPANLLDALVLRDEEIAAHRARDKIMIPTRIACFGKLSVTAAQIADEIENVTHAGTASRFLIEYVAALPPTGTLPMSQTRYDRLLALAATVVKFGMAADSIQYGLADRKVAVLGSGRIAINDPRFDNGLSNYRVAFVDGFIQQSHARFPSNWRPALQKDATPKGVAELSAAVQSEFGLAIEDIAAFSIEILAVGSKYSGEPKIVELAVFLLLLHDALRWDAAKIELAFDLFAARPRADYLTPPHPHRRDDVYPWRFNRSLSYTRRPLLVRRAGEREDVVFGMRHLHTSMRYFFDLVAGGRLKAVSLAMQRYLSKCHRREGEVFNDTVATTFAKRPGLIVRRRVKKLGKMRIARANGEPLGDIDVLVADPENRVLTATETKALSAARTPAELANEVRELFGTAPGDESAVSRHLERVDWLTRNLAETLSWLGISPVPTESWQVCAIMVVDEDLISSHIVEPRIEVITFRDLKDSLIRPADTRESSGP